MAWFAQLSLSAGTVLACLALAAQGGEPAPAFPAHWSSVRMDTGKPAMPSQLPPGFSEGDAVLQMIRFAGAQNPEMAGRAKALEPVIQKAYSDMAHDPDFKALPTALDPALNGERAPACHYFLFTPEGCGPKNAPGAATNTWPMLVFLHGAGGNFKLGLWGFVAEAAKRRCIIVCPTFDNGFWWIKPGRAFLTKVVDDVSSRYPVDEKRILLAGVSNGAAAAWGIANEERRFTAAACISGGFNGKNAVMPMTGPPLFIVHGAKDKTMPVSQARTTFKTVEKHRPGTVYKEYDDGDHYVFFERGDEILKAMFDWWEGLSRKRR